MTLTSYTNSALQTDRRCSREFDLGYEQQLEPDAFEGSEALEVGVVWHRAHDRSTKAGNLDAGYQEIRKRAATELWQEKLARLFAGYHWYWANDPLPVTDSEHTFRNASVFGLPFDGQSDGVIILPDGRKGIIERKTTGFSIGAESSYWDRLRLDLQTTIYDEAMDFECDFILYDVVRKPTIKPKRVAKKELTRMRAEVAKRGNGAYYTELFSEDEIDFAEQSERETNRMYGARLTNDIGNDPSSYFGRREVPRTTDDRRAVREDLADHILEIKSRKYSRRNPDACNAFGRPCRFFALCSNNIYPQGTVPDGYHRREHLHPELQP